MQKYSEENDQPQKEKLKETIVYPCKSHGYVAVFKNFWVTSKGKEKCKKERINEELMILWELNNELKGMDKPPHLVHYLWENPSILMAYWEFENELEIETKEDFEQIIMILNMKIQKYWKNESIRLKELTGVLCNEYIFNRDIVSIIFNTEENEKMLSSLTQAEEYSIKGMKKQAYSVSRIAKKILDINKKNNNEYAL